MRITRWIAVALLGLNLSLLSAQDMIPFAIPGQPNPQSLIRIPPEPIVGDQDRIIVRDGHFYRNGQRIRLWGVNLGFGANFPTHAEAEAVAQRLADAGVNSVRCHHMDTANYPRGLWNRKDGKTIEPEYLDRLDYFINELAKRGIYADINLHVGRSHSQYLGLPKPNSDYDKIVNLFTPQLIDAQKQFARQMLDRVNPYRKLRYADDPAVAFVEITNENSFFMWDGNEVLQALPDFYGKILQSQFNDWLKARYATSDKLRAAWNKNASPLGSTLLTNGSFAQSESASGRPAKWMLEQHDTAKAAAKVADYKQRKAVAIEIAQTDSVGWHLQFGQGGFRLEKGKYYTVIFSAAAAGKKRMPLVVAQAHDPWQNLGLSSSVDLGEDWKEFRFGFTALQSDANARISFTVGEDKTAVYLADIRLCPGGQTGLLESESIENGTVALYSNLEVIERVNDRLRFLAETEKRFFDGMRVFLKTDLGTKGLITGTIAFGPLGVFAQSDMDFIDSHSYWQHPRFPRRQWDQSDWLIDQIAMTDHPDQARLFAIASEKLAGKPFTLSEYNHPAPLDSQAECVPMVASFAAAHDWDGIWLFAYSHSGNEWNRQNDERLLRHRHQSLQVGIHERRRDALSLRRHRPAALVPTDPADRFDGPHQLSGSGLAGPPIEHVGRARRQRQGPLAEYALAADLRCVSVDPAGRHHNPDDCRPHAHRLDSRIRQGRLFRRRPQRVCPDRRYAAVRIRLQGQGRAGRTGLCGDDGYRDGPKETRRQQ